MTEPAALKRSLSLPLLILYGLGTTVGAGIYVLIGQVAGRAGLLAPLSFLVAAALAGLTAFSFAELSSRYPKSAGEALYIREGLRLPSLATAAGLAVALAGIVSASAIMLGAAGYAAELVGLPRLPLMVLLIVALGAVALWGIEQSALLASVITLIELLGLVIVIAAGVGEVDPQAAWSAVSFDTAALVGVFAGAMLAFYAFLGFEDMVNVAEEVRDAPRVMPLAIILTLVITTALYLAITLVAVLSVPADALVASEAPLVLVYESSGGRWPQVLTGIGALATMNGALVQMIMAARILYGLARQGALPAAFGRVSATTHTPLLATFIAIGATLLLALFFPIDLLAEATSVITLTVFALVNLALFAIKRRRLPRGPGLSVPAVLPLAGFLACGGFLAAEALRLISALFL